MIAKFLDFLNEKVNTNFLYRSSSEEFLDDLLSHGKVKSKDKDFVSISKRENSGGGIGDFGKVRIVFNRDEVFKQGAVEVEYNINFWNKHPDIAKHVCDFKNEEEWKANGNIRYANGQKFLMPDTWEWYIEDFEDEQEVVVKGFLKMKSALINKVEFLKGAKPSSKTEELLLKNNIPYEIK